jgi:hypothetical protein
VTRQPIFDHMNPGDDGYGQFVRAARAMLADPWWAEVAPWEEPKPVVGEIPRRGRGLAYGVDLRRR